MSTFSLDCDSSQLIACSKCQLEPLKIMILSNYYIQLAYDARPRQSYHNGIIRQGHSRLESQFYIFSCVPKNQELQKAYKLYIAHRSCPYMYEKKTTHQFCALFEKSKIMQYTISWQWFFLFLDNTEVLTHIAEIACERGHTLRCERVLNYIINIDPFSINSLKLRSRIYYDRSECFFRESQPPSALPPPPSFPPYQIIQVVRKLRIVMILSRFMMTL